MYSTESKLAQEAWRRSLAMLKLSTLLPKLSLRRSLHCKMSKHRKTIAMVQ